MPYSIRMLGTDFLRDEAKLGRLVAKVVAVDVLPVEGLANGANIVL